MRLEERTQPHGFKETVLLRVHPTEGILVTVVMTDDVEQSVQSVEDEFAGTIVTEGLGTAFRFIETAGHIGVDRFTGPGHGKGQDIGGRGITVPALMKQTHSGIIDDLHREAHAAGLDACHQTGEAVLEELEFIGSQSTGPVIDFKLPTTRRLVGLRRFRRFTPGGVAIGSGF